jgi:hypothetical protein
MQIIPITPVELKCDTCHQCKVKYIPLEVAFATTIHKCQGMSVGPSHPIKWIIGDPGIKKGEAYNPGLFYVLLSRAETLGTGNDDSAIYFCGEHMGLGRTQNMTLGEKGERYSMVKLRDKHVEVLKANEYPYKYSDSETETIFAKWLSG